MASKLWGDIKQRVGYERMQSEKTKKKQRVSGGTARMNVLN